MQQHGHISKTLWVKKALRERAHIVWFHLYDHSRTGKSNLLLAGRETVTCRGVVQGLMGWNMREFSGVVVTFCILIKIWVIQIHAFVKKISKCTLNICAFHFTYRKNKTKKIKQNWIYVYWRKQGKGFFFFFF